MLEKHMNDLLTQTLGSLHSKVRVFDEKGISLQDGSVRAIPVFDEVDKLTRSEGNTWIRTGVPTAAYVWVEGEDDKAFDTAQLAAALVISLAAEPPANDRNDVIRAALREELSGPELETLAAEYEIPVPMERCVMLFHGANNAMKELIEIGDDDIMVEMDRHSIVLLKSMDNIEGYDELEQLAEAMEQTIMSETGEQPIIAIGECKTLLFEIGASYRAAQRAMEIGRIFRPDTNIYAFNRLVLERFLAEIPRDLGMRYHHMLFNRKTQRLFNEEMLHTIEMFFAKDLNLSDTARQLYIHRNTLVYRLDKIQRQTSLDLRKFEDAITFRILLLLGKSGADKPTSVR